MIAAWWMLAARAEPVAVEVSVGTAIHRNHLYESPKSDILRSTYWLPQGDRVAEPNLGLAVSRGIGTHLVVVGSLGVSAVRYHTNPTVLYLVATNPWVTAVTFGPSIGARLQAPSPNGRWVPYLGAAPGLAIPVAWCENTCDGEPVVQIAPRVDAGAGLQWKAEGWGLFAEVGAAWSPLLSGSTLAPTAEIGVRVGR